MDFSQAYYMCYYRDSVLKSSSPLSSVGYAFRANTSDSLNPSNLNSTVLAYNQGILTVVTSWWDSIFTKFDDLTNLNLSFQSQIKLANDSANTYSDAQNIALNSSANNRLNNESNNRMTNDTSLQNQINNLTANASAQQLQINTLNGTFSDYITDGNTNWDNSYGFITSNINGNVVITGNLTLIGNTFDANVSQQNLNGSFLPALTNLFDLGSDIKKWANIYATNLIGLLDWSNITNKPSIINTTTQFSGEVSGTYDNIVLNNDALDDQYYELTDKPTNTTHSDTTSDPNVLRAETDPIWIANRPDYLNITTGYNKSQVDANFTNHETTFKHGNTTAEIRAQFTGSNNISIVNGQISFNGTLIGYDDASVRASITSNITTHAATKHGNTTDEIRAQLTGSNNISISNGAISFNLTCSQITGSADLCDGTDNTGADGVGYNSSTINNTHFADNGGILNLNISWIDSIYLKINNLFSTANNNTFKTIKANNATYSDGTSLFGGLPATSFYQYGGITGENITGGTVADARIASTITRDTEVPSLETDSAHDTCSEITNCIPNAYNYGGLSINNVTSLPSNNQCSGTNKANSLIINVSGVYLNCSADTDTTYTNSTGISLVGNTFSIVLAYFQGLFYEITDKVSNATHSDTTSDPNVLRAETDPIWIANRPDYLNTTSGYLKTEIDTQGEVETIWSVTLATDSEVATESTNLNTSVKSQINSANASANSYSDLQNANLNTSVKSQITSANTSMKSYVDTENTNQNTSLKSYTDTNINLANTSIKNWIGVQNFNSINQNVNTTSNVNFNSLNVSNIFKVIPSTNITCFNPACTVYFNASDNCMRASTGGLDCY